MLIHANLKPRILAVSYRADLLLSSLKIMHVSKSVSTLIFLLS